MSERGQNSPKPELSASAKRRRGRKGSTGPGLSRRDFLKLAAAGLGAAIGAAVAPQVKNALEEGALEHDLADHRRRIEIPAENLAPAERTAFINEGWLEPVPLNLPENYSQLSPEQQIQARIEIANRALGDTVTMMLNSRSPHFRAAAELLKDSVILQNQPPQTDGQIKLYVNPFPPRQTAAGALFSTSFRADLLSGNWFTDFGANMDRFSPESELATDPGVNTRIFLGAGLFHDLEHVRLARHMGEFLRRRLESLPDIVDRLNHDPWQEPFAHWMVAVFADSTLDWDNPGIKAMAGNNDAITADTAEYRRLLARGKQWDSDEWRDFVTKSYLSGSARPQNYPIGVAWMPPLKFEAANRPLTLDLLV